MITYVALAAIVYWTQEAPGADRVDHECNAVIQHHVPGPNGAGGQVDEWTVHPTEECPGLTMPVCLNAASVIAEASPGSTARVVLTVYGCATDLRSLVVESPANAVATHRAKLKAARGKAKP